jgi:hypothetical protein
MAELDKVKTEKVTMKIHGKVREIKFTFSAWADIEKLYGGMKNLDNLEKDLEEKPFQMLPKLLYIGLRDKEGVTEDNILDDYSLNDIEIIKDVFTKAFQNALPQEEGKNGKVEA